MFCPDRSEELADLFRLLRTPFLFLSFSSHLALPLGTNNRVFVSQRKTRLAGTAWTQITAGLVLGFSTRRQHAPRAYATGVAVIRRCAAVRSAIYRK